MEVVYTSAGSETLLIGTPLPKVGQSLAAVVESYAPHAYWAQAQTPTVAPSIGTTGSFTPPVVVPPSLSQLKETKKTAINAYRERLLASGISYAGNVFDSDNISVARLTTLGSVLLSGGTLPLGFTWRSAANVDVAFTAADVFQLQGAMVLRANDVFKTSWQKKAAVDTANTQAELAGVVWSEAGVAGGILT